MWNHWRKPNQPYVLTGDASHDAEALVRLKKRVFFSRETPFTKESIQKWGIQYLSRIDLNTIYGILTKKRVPSYMTKARIVDYIESVIVGCDTNREKRRVEQKNLVGHDLDNGDNMTFAFFGTSGANPAIHVPSQLCHLMFSYAEKTVENLQKFCCVSEQWYIHFLASISDVYVDHKNIRTIPILVLMYAKTIRLHLFSAMNKMDLVYMLENTPRCTSICLDTEMTVEAVKRKTTNRIHKYTALFRQRCTDMRRTHCLDHRRKPHREEPGNPLDYFPNMKTVEARVGTWDTQFSPDQIQTLTGIYVSYEEEDVGYGIRMLPSRDRKAHLFAFDPLILKHLHLPISVKRTLFHRHFPCLTSIGIPLFVNRRLRLCEGGQTLDPYACGLLRTRGSTLRPRYDFPCLKELVCYVIFDAWENRSNPSVPQFLELTDRTCLDFDAPLLSTVTFDFCADLTFYQLFCRGCSQNHITSGKVAQTFIEACDLCDSVHFIEHCGKVSQHNTESIFYRTIKSIRKKIGVVDGFSLHTFRRISHGRKVSGLIKNKKLK